MSAFRISGFSGLVPRMASQLLAPNQAQVATNCNLTSGDLRPRSAAKHVFSPVINRDIKSMFRMEKGGNEKWLAWDRDVDVARSPIADNSERRFYYTGDGEPRVSDYDMATAGPGPYPSGCYVLGVAPPTAKPAVTPSGGEGAAGARAYVYTFVTPWGEESKPSPPSDVTTGKVDGTWTLANLDGPPPNGGAITAAAGDMPSAGHAEVMLDSVFGLREQEEILFSSANGMTDLNGRFTLAGVDAATNKVTVELATRQAYTGGGTWARVAPHNTSGMTKRIYRTLTTAASTEYHYVATIPGSMATFSDTASDETAALGEVLPSSNWDMPPAAMKGIVIMANGIGCGFMGNEICFSESFKPYAWPVSYRQTYDHDIIAIGISGTTLVGMTKGNPFTITGVEPATMGGGMEKLGVAWPCMSKRGAAGFAFGVGYPAPQGLVVIGAQSEVVTRDLFTQKEWSELDPSTFIAASADNRYYAGYSSKGSSLMLVIDKSEAASFIMINQKITSIWADPWTGRLYIAADRKIYEWEGDAGTKLSYEWKSRRFITGSPVNYGAAKIDADFDMTETETAAAQATHAAAIAANQSQIDGSQVEDGLAESGLGELEIGGDTMQEIPPLLIDSLQFQLWADGRLRFSRQVGNSRAFRLPGGYKADNVEVVLAGNVKINSVVLAETMDGLKRA